MEEIIRALEIEKDQIERDLDRIDRMIALAGSGSPKGRRPPSRSIRRQPRGKKRPQSEAKERIEAKKHSSSPQAAP